VIDKLLNLVLRGLVISDEQRELSEISKTMEGDCAQFRVVD
jgi:hypothetical protein